jgi:hypothetical protein
MSLLQEDWNSETFCGHAQDINEQHQVLYSDTSITAATVLQGWVGRGFAVRMESRQVIRH